MGKPTYGDREWIKQHGLVGLAQDTHVKSGGGKDAMSTGNIQGNDLFGNPIVNPAKDKLSAKFFYPPFSVLNAREGWWQERKAAWLALGIKSELGRGGQLIANGGGNGSKDRYDASPGGSPRPACDYSNNQRGDGAGRPIE